MLRLDFGIYAVHASFWGAFGTARLILRATATTHAAPAGAAAPDPVSQAQTAPFSRAMLAVHMMAFGTMYFAIGDAVIPDRVPEWFPGQRLAGTFLIALGAFLAAWALVYFRSWRFRAKLDEGHQLATGGPFRHMRHPIYMGLNLLALGTALWIPTAIAWIAVALMAVGSDLRGRAEEKLLVQGFGDAYREYLARTSRFLPGIY